jgi:hypothetical protein
MLWAAPLRCIKPNPNSAKYLFSPGASYSVGSLAPALHRVDHCIAFAIFHLTHHPTSRALDAHHALLLVRDHPLLPEWIIAHPKCPTWALNGGAFADLGGIAAATV